MEDFPKLDNEQVALLRAEVNTGIVLNVHFERAIDQSSSVYSIFNSLNEAMDYAHATVRDRKDIEFCIYNKEKEILYYLNPLNPEQSTFVPKITFSDELKKRVYLEASRLKNTGHDNEVIYARLEKQGIPQELIERVILNLSIQKVIGTDKQIRPFYNIALVKIGVGVLLAIATAILIPGQIYLPIGLIATGIIYAMATKKYTL